MKSIFLSLVTIAVVAVLAVGATSAYFSDTETSTGNTFTAGTLDLKIDGGNTNVVKFNINNMAPGNQPNDGWVLANVGTINGYLDLENITVNSKENGCNEPENTAGDVTCGNPGAGEGELQTVVNLRLFHDIDKDGWIGAGETVLYNGFAGSVASSYGDISLPAGTDTRIGAIIDWWNTPNDNVAQGDGMTLDITFELGQTAAQ